MRRLLLGSVLAAALVLVVPTAANADAVRVKDARGDAPATLDITEARFSTNHHSFTMRLTVRDLRSTGRFRMLVSPVADVSHRIDVWRSHGRNHVRCVLVSYEEATTTMPERCGRAAATWNNRRNRLSVTVPMAPLAEAGPGYNPYVLQAQSLRHGKVADTTAGKKLAK